MVPDHYPFRPGDVTKCIRKAIEAEGAALCCPYFDTGHWGLVCLSVLLSISSHNTRCITSAPQAEPIRDCFREFLTLFTGTLLLNDWPVRNSNT